MQTRTGNAALQRRRILDRPRRTILRQTCSDLTAPNTGGTVLQIRTQPQPASEPLAMSDPYARYTRLKFDRPHPKGAAGDYG